MWTFLRYVAVYVIVLHAGRAAAQYQTQVVDVATRPGVTQRFLLSAPPGAKAAVILFAGGHGGLRIDAGGNIAWGGGNFLVRSAPLFAAEGLAVAVIDAPSDRQSAPYLSGFRQTAEHATDVGAVIALLRQRLAVPVWLVGTSRGTQSVAFVATHPGATRPDGLVLTSTILVDPRSRAVPDLPLDALSIPVLVVHHQQDGCRLCLYSDIPRLMARLSAVPRHELITVTGGNSVGDPCEARAYHGYNGMEAAVVSRIASWISNREIPPRQ